MQDFIILAPAALYIITLIIQLKIFARVDELAALKAELITYAAEHFVKQDTYQDNHKALQDQMLQIHQDVSDVKNLLIGIINNRNSRN